MYNLVDYLFGQWFEYVLFPGFQQCTFSELYKLWHWVTSHRGSRASDELLCLCRTVSIIRGYPSWKYVVYATACVYRELYGKITDRKKKNCANNYRDNFTKWHQNGSKLGGVTAEYAATLYHYCFHKRQVRHTFEVGKLYFKWDTQFFLQSVIFPYNSLYTQAVAYTTYFQLGEPMVSCTNFPCFVFICSGES